jgi:enamine deaminase RidA (YjgF/YER057c/UK114 family)
MKTCGLLALACAVAVTAWPLEQRKKKEEETQTLQLPRELPAAVSAETRRLAFQVSPLSARGLLSQQVRDALHALGRASGGTVVGLRAFVAGRGDLRRVRDLVSEYYTERRQPLPVLSVVQVGGLPLEGAQVVLESIAVARKEVNSSGLAFLSGQGVSGGSPLDPVAPLAARALDKLRAAVSAAGAEPKDVLRLTCFLSSLEDFPAVRLHFDREYPRAARNFVQTQRAPSHAYCECEAVARLSVAPGAPLESRGVPGTGALPGRSEIALVAAPHVVFSGMQSAFGFQDADARLAFERLEKAMEGAGASLKMAAFARFYPLSPSIAAQVAQVRGAFFDAARPPAMTMLPFEGLPSMDAGFAADVIAIKP